MKSCWATVYLLHHPLSSTHDVSFQTTEVSDFTHFRILSLCMKKFISTHKNKQNSMWMPLQCLLACSKTQKKTSWHFTYTKSDTSQATNASLVTTDLFFSFQRPDNTELSRFTGVISGSFTAKHLPVSGILISPCSDSQMYQELPALRVCHICSGFQTFVRLLVGVPRGRFRSVLPTLINSRINMRELCDQANCSHFHCGIIGPVLCYNQMMLLVVGQIPLMMVHDIID